MLLVREESRYSYQTAYRILWFLHAQSCVALTCGLAAPLGVAARLARHATLAVVHLGAVLEQETQVGVLVVSVEASAGVGCAKVLAQLLCGPVVLSYEVALAFPDDPAPKHLTVILSQNTLQAVFC